MVCTMPTTEAMTTERIDRVFKALASAQRREIVRLLATGGGAGDARCCSEDEVCACVFAEKLGLSAPTVSHHMKALLEAELVASEKRGQWVYYRLRSDTLAAVGSELMSLAGCARGGCS
jgi:ArsR family transcriptional regulator